MSPIYRTFQIKVTDFSLGSILLPASKGFVHDQRGSPAYISPEVLSGRPYNAMRSDMWSVGVILYKILTGMWLCQGCVAMWIAETGCGSWSCVATRRNGMMR